MMDNQHKREIERRIGTLNRAIDRKIIMGKPYKKQAKEHKDLYYYLKGK